MTTATIEDAIPSLEVPDLKQVRIPGQEYLTYEVELTGIAPGLLMNRLDPGVLSFPGFKSTRPPVGDVSKLNEPSEAKPARRKKGAKEDRTTVASNVAGEVESVLRVDPVAAFRAARSVAYLASDGTNELVCPADNLKAMLCAAAMAWPKTGLGRTIGACFFVEEYEIKFRHPDSGKALKFDDTAKLVTNQYAPQTTGVCYLVKSARGQGNKRILTSRVFLPRWQLAFRVRYDASMIDVRAAEGVVRKAVWDYAGGYIGQMSWRPSAYKSGPFGRFLVTRYKRLEI